MGIEQASGCVFELPNGSKLIARSDDDAFLNEPYQPGTKLSLLISGRAGACVKMAGDCWLIYQNDPDENWPSNFHAHNRVRPETLDCHTGKIYDPRTKKLVRQYSPKRLKMFQSQVPDRVKP
jgi:hypothetical protein